MVRETVLILAIALTACSVNAQHRDWLSVDSSAVVWLTLDQAIEENKQSNKPMLIFVCVSWCEPCYQLMTGILQDSIVGSFLNHNFLPVRFRGEGKDTVRIGGKTFINHYWDEGSKQKYRTHPWENHMNLDVYPSWVVMDHTGQVKSVTPVASDTTEDEFIMLMAKGYVAYRSKE